MSERKSYKSDHRLDVLCSSNWNKQLPFRKCFLSSPTSVEIQKKLWCDLLSISSQSVLISQIVESPPPHPLFCNFSAESHQVRQIRYQWSSNALINLSSKYLLMALNQDAEHLLLDRVLVGCKCVFLAASKDSQSTEKINHVPNKPASKNYMVKVIRVLYFMCWLQMTEQY